MPGVFLEGPKGIGKTTVLFRVLNFCLRDLKRRRCSETGTGNESQSPDSPKVGGFVVKKVVTRDGRVAHDMVDLMTRERVRLVDIHPDGRRTMHREAFVKVGLPAIERAAKLADIVVMDELGKIELGAPSFTTAVLSILAGPKPVAGVLKDESNEFLDAVRVTPGVRVIRLSAETRESDSRELRAAILEMIGLSPQTPRQA